MDVTDKESIQAGKKLVEEDDGKLHILVNKYVDDLFRLYWLLNFVVSAGQPGPTSMFIYDRKDHFTAASFGDALFKSETFEEWSDNLSVNVSAYYFVSAAFLGLLGAGAEHRQGVTSCIVNITSTSGLAKISQDHVLSASD